MNRGLFVVAQRCRLVVIAGDHEPPFSRLRQSHKDIRLIVEHGEGVVPTVDLARVVRATMAEEEETGLADLDNGAVVEVVRRRAGIGRILK